MPERMGMILTFRSGSNARIFQFSALVKDITDTSQNQQYAVLPTGANAAGFMGLLIEHFVEPDYFVRFGTDPTSVTGTAPSQFNLSGRAAGLQVDGIAKALAAGAINQGDPLCIADAYGRVNSVSNLGLAPGTANCIGTAVNSVTQLNGEVKVELGAGLI